MNNNKQLRVCNTFVFFIFLTLAQFSLNATCAGRFTNPITDICWKCIFPIRLAGMQIAAGQPEPPNHNNTFICYCARPGIHAPVPGIPVSFWEPVRMVDVTRIPYCLVNLGVRVGSSGIMGAGDTAITDNEESRSFYHVHWYIYPLIYWLELITDFICLEKSGFDLAYLTELDPLWNSDVKSLIFNPEAILFGNPIAQTACAGDCATATATYALDPLFWCSGCQGSVYPFTGNVSSHVGGVQASSLLVTRFMAKLHRQGLLWGYIGKPGLCGKYAMPIIKKSQYRLQMTYPIANTVTCPAIGATTALWGAGREFPAKGSDFGYMVWRKRECCML